jgi:hypothetical protein
MWKSILLKRQFVIGTSSDLFKMIPSKCFDEKSRFRLIDFLVQKKILVKSYWFSDAKGSPILGYMKGSPADPDVSLAMAHFGIDIEEYKRSLNPHQNVKCIIGGNAISASYLFSNQLHDAISNDEWFKENLYIEEKVIYKATELSATSSNTREYLISTRKEKQSMFACSYRD